MLGWFLPYRFVGFTSAAWMVFYFIFSSWKSTVNLWAVAALSLFAGVYDQNNGFQKATRLPMQVTVLQNKTVVEVSITNYGPQGQPNVVRYMFDKSALCFVEHTLQGTILHMQDGSRIVGNASQEDVNVLRLHL